MIPTSFNVIFYNNKQTNKIKIALSEIFVLQNKNVDYVFIKLLHPEFFFFSKATQFKKPSNFTYILVSSCYIFLQI
jgi:hypothetical protein